MEYEPVHFGFIMIGLCFRLPLLKISITIQNLNIAFIRLIYLLAIV